MSAICPTATCPTEYGVSYSYGLRAVQETKPLMVENLSGMTETILVITEEMYDVTERVSIMMETTSVVQFQFNSISLFQIVIQMSTETLNVQVTKKIKSIAQGNRKKLHNGTFNQKLLCIYILIQCRLILDSHFYVTVDNCNYQLYYKR